MTETIRSALQSFVDPHEEPDAERHEEAVDLAWELLSSPGVEWVATARGSNTNKDAPAHFYASSVARWEVSIDPAELVDRMKMDTLPFALWWVPVYISAPYEIAAFAPQVPGALIVAQYNIDID